MKEKRKIILRFSIFMLVILSLSFGIYFNNMLINNIGLILQKKMHGLDEMTNSAVSANITRKIFPPMLRLNSLIDSNANWAERPHWQHIPPLFTYIPYIFFKIHGNINIVVERLSYAFLIFISGLAFIIIIYFITKNLAAITAAFLATLFWIATPFTQKLITGEAFGTSDIMLSFSAILSFGAISYYLSKIKSKRINYSSTTLIILGIIVSLPILSKNLLGAIPPLILFSLIIYDQKKINFKLVPALLSFALTILIYYGILFISSPKTFMAEIMVSSAHFGDYEGWTKPWHYFITHYLPQNYLVKFNSLFWIGLFASILILIFASKKIRRVEKNILFLSLFWFLWNLAAVTIIKSKSPNFIYQSYLFSLFFVVGTPLILASGLTIVRNPVKIFSNFIFKNKLLYFYMPIIILCSITILYFYSLRLFWEKANAQKNESSYQSSADTSYLLGEYLQKEKINKDDLIILNYSNDDCFSRFSIIFLTGAEARTSSELHYHKDTNKIKKQYKRIFFIFYNQYRPNEIPNPDKNQEEVFINYKIKIFNLESKSEEEIKNIINSYDGFFLPTVTRIEAENKQGNINCSWLIEN